MVKCIPGVKVNWEYWEQEVSKIAKHLVQLQNFYPTTKNQIKE